MKRHLHIAILLIGTLIITNVQAQDIEQITKAKPVAVSGSLSASSSFYNINGAPDRQPPFFWSMGANLNFTFFGLVSAPFSFNYSPQGDRLSYPFQRLQPFNQMGISPTYKGITAHIGYRNMSFSNYTLSGSNFMGGGIEIKRKNSKFEYTAMFGRLARAIQDTALLVNNPQPIISGYTRLANAYKLKHRDKSGNTTEVILMKAWDNESSLVIPKELVEAPQDNFVVSTTTNRKITKKLSLNVEYALSMLTRDASSSEANNLNNYSFLNNLGPLFKYRSTTSTSGALNSGLSYNLGKAQAKLTYRRISPNYISLGIPFINNDLEEISTSLAWRMLKNKLNINTTGGVQRNNLDRAKNAINRRLIGSLNTSYAISKKWTATANFSNFNTSVTKVRINTLDSLNYYQLTRNLTIGTNYRLKQTKKSIHGITVNYSSQLVNDIAENNSSLHMTNAGYSMSFPEKGLNSSIAANYNANSHIGLENPGYGATLSLGKKLFKKKVDLTMAVSQLNFSNSGQVVDRTQNVRTSIRYTLKKKHSTSLNLNYIDKVNVLQNIDFTEYRITLQYGYNFSK